MKVQKINVDQLIMEENVRLPGDVQNLANDIEARGLTTRPLVWARGDEFVVLRGHRRTTALLLIQDQNPERFRELDPIECDVVEGITHAQALDLKVDHGNELGLTHPHELQMSASMLFDAGKTEREVITQLAGLMDRLHPMKPSQRVNYEKLLADQSTLGQAEAEKFLLDYRRGLVQALHCAHRCPQIVMDALWKKATGKNPENYMGTELIALTSANVISLYKAYKLDLTILEDGVPKHSRLNPGPNFWERWDAISLQLATKAANKVKGVTTPKSKSATELKDEVTRWNSKGFRQLCLYHAGEDQLAGLKEIDELLYRVECMVKNDPFILDELEGFENDD